MNCFIFGIVNTTALFAFVESKSYYFQKKKVRRREKVSLKMNICFDTTKVSFVQIIELVSVVELWEIFQLGFI